jgi:predicted site-specific integrase-resolvase
MTESDEKTYGPLYPLDEGADQLGVPINTLRWWIQQGLIESHKLFGRRLISEEEILRLREASRIPARGEKRPRVIAATLSTRGRGSR